jgi:putative ABC transport system ATP-binding protein
VFQRIHLLPNLTALENVVMPLLIDGVARAERQSRAEEMLAVVGMSHRAASFPATMSGGEQQRVAIARALVCRPALILADEPTGALDSANGRMVTELLRNLVTGHGQTVVVVTHDAFVASQTDRRVRVLDGKLSEEAAESVMADFEPPQSQGAGR